MSLPIARTLEDCQGWEYEYGYYGDRVALKPGHGARARAAVAVIHAVPVAIAG